MRVAVKISNMPKKFGAKYHRDRRNALREVAEGTRIQKRPHMSEAEQKREITAPLKAARESANSPLPCSIVIEVRKHGDYLVIMFLSP